MPRWAIWVMNVAVVAVLASLVYFFKWAGTEFVVGCLVGFWFCYISYRCWRQDYADEAQAHFTDQPTVAPRPPSQRHLSDH